jgi:hypothetical protein
LQDELTYSNFTKGLESMDKKVKIVFYILGITFLVVCIFAIIFGMFIVYRNLQVDTAGLELNQAKADEKEAILRYLEESDKVLSTNTASPDETEDELVADLETLKSLEVPKPAKEYHTFLLDNLSFQISVVKTLKDDEARNQYNEEYKQKQIQEIEDEYENSSKSKVSKIIRDKQIEFVNEDNPSQIRDLALFREMHERNKMLLELKEKLRKIAYSLQ